MERLVSLITLLLDGANAEEHPITAAMKTAESIVLVMVSIAMGVGVFVIRSKVIMQAQAITFQFFLLELVGGKFGKKILLGLTL